MVPKVIQKPPESGLLFLLRRTFENRRRCHDFITFLDLGGTRSNPKTKRKHGQSAVGQNNTKNHFWRAPGCFKISFCQILFRFGLKNKSWERGPEVHAFGFFSYLGLWGPKLSEDGPRTFQDSHFVAFGMIFLMFAQFRIVVFTFGDCFWIITCSLLSFNGFVYLLVDPRHGGAGRPQGTWISTA